MNLKLICFLFLFTSFSTHAVNFRPFAEYERVKTFITSALFFPEIKNEIIANLPSEIDILLTVENKESQNLVTKFYTNKKIKNRFKVIIANGTMTEWLRDGAPFPVISNNMTGLIDSIYPYWEEDTKISKIFNLPLKKFNYNFEGGNILSDTKGNCFIVDNVVVKKIPDLQFKNSFGCSNIYRMPHIKGIGHIDEHLKLLSDNDVLTDLVEYKNIIQKLGYRVTMLPQPNTENGTYLNSVIINDLIFVPVFNESSDTTAISIYKKFNFKIIPIIASKLAKHAGLLHCTTMTYPDSIFLIK